MYDSQANEAPELERSWKLESFVKTDRNKEEESSKSSKSHVRIIK